MPNNPSKWAFVFRDSRAALDGPMMRLRGLSAPLSSVRVDRHGTIWATRPGRGRRGADGKPLACPETERGARDGSVGPTRARASHGVWYGVLLTMGRPHAREGFT